MGTRWVALAAAALISAAASAQTEVVLVVDRSGSMQETLSDAQGALTGFIEDRRRANPETVFTLVEFDDRFDVVVERRPISQFEGYRLSPRGNTALLDAVGRATKMAWNSDAKLKVFVVLTDGLENASTSWTLPEVREQIEHLQHDGWQIVYLAKGLDAFAAGNALGISNGLQYDASNSSWDSATTLTSGAITDAEVSGSSTIELKP